MFDYGSKVNPSPFFRLKKFKMFSYLKDKDYFKNFRWFKKNVDKNSHETSSNKQKEPLKWKKKWKCILYMYTEKRIAICKKMVKYSLA